MARILAVFGVVCAGLLVTNCGLSAEPRVRIDGQFNDWAAAKSYTDHADDTHATGHKGRNELPQPVDHPDVDLVEYKVAHDNDHLYCYLRSRGRIANTQIADGTKRAGRYYVIVTIDADDNDDTGYWLHEGGYYPTSRGYDLNAEVEYYNGELNTACYLNHGARDAAELRQAFLDQSTGPVGEWAAGEGARRTQRSAGESPTGQHCCRRALASRRSLGRRRRQRPRPR